MNAVTDRDQPERKTYREILGDETCDQIAKCVIEQFKRDWREVVAIEPKDRNKRLQMLILRMATSRLLDRTCMVRETEALRERVAALEARPAVKDMGVWKMGATYREGSMVTHRRNLWIAQGDTIEEPGGNRSWRLAIREWGDDK